MAFIQSKEPDIFSDFIACDKHEVFFAIEKVPEPVSCFLLIEVKCLNTYSVHDFTQQLANHYGDFM